MQTEKDTDHPTRIAFVGKFGNLHDEEYIARSFEAIGCDVIRIEQSTPGALVHRKIVQAQPDVLLFTKWEYPGQVYDALQRSKAWGMKTVCWLFDLYWGYEREFRIARSSYFKADIVATTDGGNDEKWGKAGVNHVTVRQGIYAPECRLVEPYEPEGIVFVGSENPCYPERTAMIERLRDEYGLIWHGRTNTNAIRGMALNELYSRTKIVVGDSVYSPHYWSNRVVETLGRGGFLIHRDVPGLKEEYPDIVTYDGTYEDLKRKIDYYLEHEDERLEIVRRNHALVASRYTSYAKCQEILDHVKAYEDMPR